MAVLAALAVALATTFAAAAQGAPVTILAPLLLLAAGGVAVRRSKTVLPPGRDVVVLTAVTVGGFVALYVAGWTTRAHQGDVARLLPWVVLGLSLLWPEPNVLRYCLLLAGAAILGTTVMGGASPSREVVGGALVAMAVALVATNRLTAASGPRLGGPAPTSVRRTASEAAVVLIVVGLLAALAAALVPPPPGGGGGGDGNGGRGSLVRPAAPGVDFADRLDVGAGRGRRGNEIVFLVDAPGPDVWRATTYDHWDGESWERSPETLSTLEFRALPGIGDIAGDADRLDLDFRQSVTVEAQSAAMLVAAARPAFAASNRPVREGKDTTLTVDPPLRRGERYTVYSERSPARPEVLRAATGAVPPDVADAYLQLPAVAARVRDLAAQIAGGKATTYDKARAVERWLFDNTTVTADAKGVPAGEDALERFLLEDRSGPPERTATAMTVLLRALGVPARIAVGFLPGTRNGPDGEYVVRLRDTHAWVEVWFPGIGWQRFDPTGKAPPLRPEHQSVWDRLKRLWPLLAVIVLAALAFAAWWAVRRWRREAARPWASRFLARLEREGRARGRPRQPQETPAEYATDLARTVLPDPRLEEVGELVTVGAYSGREPPAQERARAEDVLRAAARSAPVRRLRHLRRPTIPRP